MYFNEINCEYDFKMIDCENLLRLLLNTTLMNSDDLLAILNSVNMGTQFSIELNVNKLLFLVPLIIKPGKKIWKNLYSKPTDSKRYVSNVSNHPTTCLRNIPFCRARHICMIVEYTNIRYMKIKELRTILKI